MDGIRILGEIAQKNAKWTKNAEKLPLREFPSLLSENQPVFAEVFAIPIFLRIINNLKATMIGGLGNKDANADSL